MLVHVTESLSILVLSAYSLALHRWTPSLSILLRVIWVVDVYYDVVIYSCSSIDPIVFWY